MENVLTMMEAIVVNAKWDINLTQLARSAWVSDIVPDMLHVSLFAKRLAVRRLRFAVCSSRFKFTGVTNNDNGEFMVSGYANYNGNTTNHCYD